MMRRAIFLIVLASSLVAPFASLPALAQDTQDQQRTSLKPTPPPMIQRQGPSALMQSLYATTAVVQAIDWHSKMKAIDAGAVEKSPLIAPLTKNRGAYAALKIGIAATAILAAHDLSRHHKIRAAVALVAVNLVYGAMSVHNYHVARDMRLAGGH